MSVIKRSGYVMNEVTRQNIIWGWLRMILGALQMTLAPLALFLVFSLGIYDERTWILIVLTTLVTGISRLLYRGRPDPRILKK
jgi:hypothetical protein